MYPVRSQVVRQNAQFIFGLGEQLPSAAELMATDPGVSSLQAQLDSANATVDMLMNTPVAITYSKREGGRNRKPRNVTVTETLTGRQIWQEHHDGRIKKYGCRHAYVGKSVYCQSSAVSVVKRIGDAQKRVEDIKKRLKEAEKRVWDRISKAVNYKTFSIKPIIDRGANSITYQITKDGANVGSPHQRLDEAKAVIDEDIAKGQQKQVDQWAEERGRAEGVLPPPQATTVSAATAADQSKLPVILLAGGAAVAGILLLGGGGGN